MGVWLKSNREIGVLVALFALFSIFSLYLQNISEEVAGPAQPSSFSTAPRGVKALYLLLQKQGYIVDRLKTDYRVLGSEDGLLFAIEPMERALKAREVQELRRWTQAGGVVIYLADARARPKDPDDVLFGDVAVISMPEKAVELHPVRSPFTEAVRTVRFKTAARLVANPGGGYQRLLGDASGAVMLHKRVGKGHAFLGTIGTLAGNTEIRNADNAVLFVNIAARAVGSSRKVVLFDEYHHGTGFQVTGGDKEGVFQTMPPGLRLGILHGMALLLLLVYNANRRLGAPLPAMPMGRRPVLDYVSAMAGLLRRAHAADIALLNFYHRFRKELIAGMALPPDTPPDQLSRLAERRYGQQGKLAMVLRRCEEVAQGTRISDSELQQLYRDLESLRKRTAAGSRT